MKMGPKNVETDGQDFVPELEPVEEECSQGDNEKLSKLQPIWRNVIFMSLLHMAALYGFTLMPGIHTYSLIWTFFLYVLTCFSVTGGAHRLWAHRTYKAKLPLRIFYAFANLIAFQNCIYDWARDHRSHHKFSDSNADPHNSKRGVFFSHIGWLLVKKHPDVAQRSKESIDVSDLLADPVVRIQRKYYLPGVLIMCFVIPTIIPWLFWSESLYASYFINISRYISTLHATWLVNSAAHKWGRRPYDKSIPSVENYFVSFFAIGEGFHNYHHVFPHDYSASEHKYFINPTTFFIDCLAMLGFAYDRRKMSKDIVMKRKRRTGDLSSKSG